MKPCDRCLNGQMFPCPDAWHLGEPHWACVQWGNRHDATIAKNKAVLRQYEFAVLEAMTRQKEVV